MTPCGGCGKRFTVTRSNRRFCSWECRSGSAMQVRECATCHDTFRAFRSDPQRYCGRPCWAKATRTATAQAQFTCVECGKKFTRAASKAKAQRQDVKYCGRDCLGAANGRRLAGPRTRIAKACLVCGAAMSVVPALAERKKFCSHKCRGLGVHELRNRTSRPRSSKIGDDAIRLWAERNPSVSGWKAEHRVSRWTIDLAFPGLMLAVELDGVYWHSRPGMPEKDRARDAALTKRGWTVRRIPMEQGATAAQVASAIGRAVNAHARRRTVAA